MAIIRKVFGPFAPEHHLPGHADADDYRWYFFGIRGNGEMAHWVLIYDPRTRKFKAAHTGTTELIGRHRIALGKQGIRFSAGDCKHPDMFLRGDTSLTEDDTITNILRRKLSPSEIAKATALSIARR